MNNKQIKAPLRIVLLVLSIPFCIIGDVLAGPFRPHGQEFHTEACYDQLIAAWDTLLTGEEY